MLWTYLSPTSPLVRWFGGLSLLVTLAVVMSWPATVPIHAAATDCKGDAASLQAIFDARPDVLNHNLETVARLQRAVRPSAGYARSLGVLARARNAGLPTKSG